VLHAEPAITITTFHGWFARLLGGAPLDSGLAGRSLDAAASSLLDEAWVLLAADCGRSAESPLAQALLWLYGEQGAFTTRKLVVVKQFNIGLFFNRRLDSIRGT
jgi:ATP-dependent helicase/nuclease subunit A